MNRVARVLVGAVSLVIASSPVFAGVVSVPEPASLGLLAAGLAGLSAVAGWRAFRGK